MALSRDAILNCNDKKMECIDVPEWGGSVNVRVISAKERERWERQAKTMEDKLQVRASLVVLTTCDDDGKLIFTLDDVALLNEKCFPAVDRVFNLAIKINRISNEDVDNAAKN